MRKNDSPSIAVLKSVLGGKVVSYHPVFARALRSVPAAVMLSQAYFWQENSHHRELKEIDGCRYFTATAAEWYESTGVTDDAQVTARKVLCDSGFWREKRAGVPAKLYFHIDLETLVSVIYGYLNSGIQVSVDNRSKNREYTRSSDGTFRQPVSVIYGNTNKVETNIETNKRARGEVTRAENQPDVEKEKKEKAPPIPGAPPAGVSRPVATTFAESIWSNATTGAFAQALHEYAPETADADAGYYRGRCRDWSAQHPDKKKADWLAFAAQIINDDRGRHKLVTIQPISSNANGLSSNHHAPGSAGEPLVNLDRLRERARDYADRFKAKNPGRYKQ